VIELAVEQAKTPESGEKQSDVVQCVCGTYIRSPADYDLVFLKKDQMEIDIICPNPDCYLHELGFIKFKVESGKPYLVDARFYSPFCTWNASRMGRETMEKKLRQHLIWLVEEGVDWKGVMTSLKKYEDEKAQAERVRQEARAKREAGGEIQSASDKSSGAGADASASSKKKSGGNPESSGGTERGVMKMVVEYSVEVENLSKTYVMGKGGSIKVPAIDEVSFKIKRGEFMLLMGPSGSGKTTLFNMIGGLDKPTEGTVYIDEVDISKLDAYELAWLRNRKIGYIFQTFNLIPVLTAYENVELPMIFAGVDREERDKKVKELLERVGLGERMHHKPNELSGGQQQRVAIARALANDPAIILADEPTGNLDLNTGLEIINLLKELNREKGVTIMTATHDLKLLDVADRILWLRDGKVERIEERAEVTVESSAEQGTEGEVKKQVVS